MWFKNGVSVATFSGLFMENAISFSRDVDVSVAVEPLPCRGACISTGIWVILGLALRNTAQEGVDPVYEFLESVDKRLLDKFMSFG